MDNFKKIMYESRPKIGWVHGISASLFALICAYLTMMIFTTSAPFDNVLKILPSMIVIPILISCYGLFFLFSKNYITLFKKILFTILLLTCLFLIIFKVF